MLKYLSKMSLVNWVLVLIGLFVLFSLGKIITIMCVSIVLLLLVGKYWHKIIKLLERG